MLEGEGKIDVITKLTPPLPPKTYLCIGIASINGQFFANLFPKKTRALTIQCKTVQLLNNSPSLDYYDYCTSKLFVRVAHKSQAPTAPKGSDSPEVYIGMSNLPGGVKTEASSGIERGRKSPRRANYIPLTQCQLRQIRARGSRSEDCRGCGSRGQLPGLR